MNLSLGKKIMGGFLLVVVVTAIGSGITVVGLNQLKSAAKESNKRTSDAQAVSQVAFWAVKQYQNQADLIINRDLEMVEEFRASAEEFEKANAVVDALVDTPEEIALNEAMDVATRKIKVLLNETQLHQIRQ